MRVSFTTEQKSTATDVDAIWLDRYGNLYEWAGDDWYLLATRQETDWRMPGGFTAEQVLIEGVALGLSDASPFERPDGLVSEYEFDSLRLHHVSGFVRLSSSQEPFSLATMIPAAGSIKRSEQEWLIEDGARQDLFLASRDAFARPWRVLGLLGPRARPSALAERA